MKFCLAAIAAMSVALPAVACELDDDTHQHLSFTHSPHRIVTLAPHLAELVSAAGAEQYLVGVSTYSDYPEPVKSLPRIADSHAIDVERILSLKPDLIIAWSDRETPQLLQLKQFGIPIYYNHIENLADISTAIRKMGCITQSNVVAEKAAQQFDEQLNAIKKSSAKKPIVSVFFELNDSPLVTISQRSFINEAITVCGGHNIFEDQRGAAPEIDREAVVKANPDVFISIAQGEWTTSWQQWTTLSAVKHHNFFTVNANILAKPTPRILQGITQICEALDVARERAKRE